MRRFGWSWLGAGVLGVAAAMLSGCGEDLGTCNEEKAFTVVYDSLGYPYAEGQALAHQSCGGTSFCHSALAEGANRKGAPAGLNFDVQTLPSDATMQELARVSRGATELRNWDVESYSLVVDGEMPPGEVGQSVISPGSWALYLGNGMYDDDYELPSIGSSNGQEIFRNWLACGAPTLQQPQPPEFPRREASGGPTWDTIYPVIEQQCASAACHATGSSFNGGLVLDDKCGALSNMIGQAAPMHSSDDATTPCDMDDGVLIQPGNADASLFYGKLLPSPSCGQRMPFGTQDGLEQSVTSNIQQWINDGAQAPADCM